MCSAFVDDKGANSSHFMIEGWNGTEWIGLLFEDQNSCPWSDVWNSLCINHFNSEIDTLKNQDFQVRFIYSDGDSGEWTGMIAMDNFLLKGSNPVISGCADPLAANYNEEAVINDFSCYSCENGKMDGLETGIDCGGTDCPDCIIYCNEESSIIYEVDSNTSYSDIDTIIVEALIDQEGVGIYPGHAAILNPGFEVMPGHSIEVMINTCEE